MTRADAIDYVLGSASGLAGEFATSPEEESKIHQEAREALIALGVSQDELDTAEWYKQNWCLRPDNPAEWLETNPHAPTRTRALVETMVPPTDP